MDEVTEMAEYRDVGAGLDWLFLSVRAPFDADEIDRFAAEIVPALA